MTGQVLHIERLAVHDGPGLRTTIFLKGCSLRCRWCHNPESVSPQPEVGLLLRRCVRCGECAKVCPHEAHLFEPGGHRLDHDRCVACGRCVEACLPGALEFYGRELSAAEAVAAVLEDRTFYAQSGGGCTLSGGEPLLQPEFCAAVLQRLRSAGVHGAIDTSGAVPWSSFATVLPHTDLFLFDLKHADDQVHQAHTGGSNRVILDNLQRLSTSGVPVEIRIPLIPGCNADEVSLAAMGELLGRLPNLTQVRLLPYHLARQKYETVGRPDTMPDVPPPSGAAIARAVDILQGCGLTTVV